VKTPFKVEIGELEIWLRFVLVVLATWRVTHLLAREDGPADLLVRLRARLGSGFFGGLVDCFYCLSLWVAVPMAFLVGRRPLDCLLAWLALSGAACLLQRIVEQPVVIQPISETHEGSENDGMLRSEKNRFEKHAGTGDRPETSDA
jgi:hypothetical protein